MSDAPASDSHTGKPVPSAGSEPAGQAPAAAAAGQAPAATGTGATAVEPGTGVLAPGAGEKRPATVLAAGAQEPAAPGAGTTAPGSTTTPGGLTNLVARAVPEPFTASALAARLAREMGFAHQPEQSAPAPAPGTATGLPSAAEELPGTATGVPGMAPRLAWVAVPSGMRMAGGWETWRFLPDKRLSRYYPAGTWTITATAKGEDGATVTKQATFQLKRETRMSSVQAENVRGARGVRLTGSLRRVDPRGYSDYTPFAKQDVDILWRESMSEPWERVATATTGTTGEFARTVPARAGGFWRARYAGTGHYSSKVSRLHQST